ncbi:hypothetical protein C8R43DRAFT_36907 [Mycena crocata]|nr:hypothetical protein C8R43DRAFT_36907 [Mycena crocata]
MLTLWRSAAVNPSPSLCTESPTSRALARATCAVCGAFIRLLAGELGAHAAGLHGSLRVKSSPVRKCAALPVIGNLQLAGSGEGPQIHAGLPELGLDSVLCVLRIDTFRSEFGFADRGYLLYPFDVKVHPNQARDPDIVQYKVVFCTSGSRHRLEIALHPPVQERSWCSQNQLRSSW